MTAGVNVKKYLIVGATAAVIAVVVWTAARPGSSTGSDGVGRLGGPATWDPATRRHVDQQHAHIDDMIQHGEFLQARYAADKLVREYPGDAAGFGLLARVLIAQNEWQPAYDAARRSVELNPSDAEAQFLAGVLAEKVERPQDAAEHYLKATDQEPGSAKYPLYLANALLKLNRLDEAQLYVLRVLKLDPALAQPHVILSEIASRQGNLDMAIEQIDRALLNLKPDDTDRLAYTLMRVKLLRRRDAAGRQEALNTLASLPESIAADERSVTEELAMTYLSLERPADAGDAWARWFATHQTDVAAAAEAGLAYQRAGNLELAKQYLAIAQQLKPHHPLVQALDEAISD